MPAGEGVSGRVMATGQPYLNNDASTDPLITKPEALGELKAIACAPLIAEKQVIGAVWIARTRAITPDELRILTAVADIAANAIHRASLHEQTERQLERLAVLHTIDTTIASSLDVNLTFAVLIEEITARLKVDAADILLLNPNSMHLEYRAGRGFRNRASEKIHLRMGEGYAGRALTERRISVITDAAARAQDTDPSLSRLRAESFVAYYCVPLIVKAEVKGVLELFHRAPLPPTAEWLDFLDTLARQAAIAIDNVALFNDLQHSTLELGLAYDSTIEGWSRAMDLRDRETEGHTQRVTEMTVMLAKALGVSDKDLVHVRRGALLHDVGKVGVPDNVLLKQGELSEEEWRVMRKHPQYAYEMLSPIAYLKPALDIPYCHHEKWDGTGYPRGLKGEQIPLAARFFAVVDVWDALTTDRPYRGAWNPKQAREYVREQSGKHFDPEVVRVFLRMIHETESRDA
jgi:HD-GYP domain-containing protein (c-di-GMP phosphodiesterase class II)